MDKRIIIGLGTGRCGTDSFSDLIKRQNIVSTHEYSVLPWVFSDGQLNKMIDILKHRKGRIVSDTAFYYLPYVEHLIDVFNDIRFVCLRRPMGKTVKSYMSKTTERNHWCDDGVSKKDDDWDKCYPTYDINNKRTAIKMYWREYYNRAAVLESKYPYKFKMFNFNKALNTERGQKRMFNFIGLKDPTIILNIVRNKSKD